MLTIFLDKPMQKVEIPNAANLMSRSPEAGVCLVVGNNMFIDAMVAIRIASAGTKLSGYISQFDDESPVLTWIKGEPRGGVSFVLAMPDELRKSGTGEYVLRTKSPFPELRLLDEKGKGRTSEQLTLTVGDFGLSPYSIPSNVAYDRSGVYLGLSYERVANGLAGVSVEPRSTLALYMQSDGAVGAVQDRVDRPDVAAIFARRHGNVHLVRALFEKLI
jgi:hypothetical protein